MGDDERNLLYQLARHDSESEDESLFFDLPPVPAIIAAREIDAL